MAERRSRLRYHPSDVKLRPGGDFCLWPKRANGGRLTDFLTFYPPADDRANLLPDRGW
jgi:hypothetical protein